MYALPAEPSAPPSPPSPPPRKMHKMLFSFGSAAVAKSTAAAGSQRVVPVSATNTPPVECQAGPGASPPPAAVPEQSRRWSPQRALLSQIRGGHRRFSIDALPSGIRPVRDLWHSARARGISSTAPLVSQYSYLQLRLFLHNAAPVKKTI
ncbi:hypothetical protein RRG08_044664 [Elysia crispata]|uniref:Uncharacterized protein n=1 Tax=Elysia crispata TaxID=231223 RepID=A0AAE0Z6Y8_9GAST|nr:hypothetical protein RRG08_044664 [Elysia crispata]